MTDYLQTHKKLPFYNLFSDSDTIIKSAVIVSKSQIELSLKKEVYKDEITLKSYNYQNKHIDGNYDSENVDFELVYLSDYKYILLGQFDFSKNYFIKHEHTKANVIIDTKPGGILDKYFAVADDEQFGSYIQDGKTDFKVWSPPAGVVELVFYDENLARIKKNKAYLLERKKNGVWQISLPDAEFRDYDVEKIYYRYEIISYGKKRIALDPYSKSMAAFSPDDEDKIGFSAIVSYAKKTDEYSGHKKNVENVNPVIYEINVRDFTIQKESYTGKFAGTFSGFAEKIDYLQNLGITHVQLMPIQQCYTTNDTDRNYTGKTAKKSNYNWGYDPMNYFTLNGRYSLNPENPISRINEFKQLVNKLHQAGIGVIIDVVFNHTYAAETFENIAPGCYYRYINNYEISGITGAGATLETRHKTVRKFIIDTLKYYVSEFNVDGFRFDLMEFIDHETMNQIRNEVGKLYNPNDVNELILHGEAWEFSDIDKDKFSKINYNRNSKYRNLNIAIFNDSFRDALAGNGHQHGFIHGNLGETSRLASGIVGALSFFEQSDFPFNEDVFYDAYNTFADKPLDCLNYFSIHDGLTLWDKINLTVKNPEKTDRLRLMKFAASILFTSQGKIILHGGDEILRTKPLSDFDIEKSRALTSDFVDEEENTVFFHENSYSSADYTNMFRWDRLYNEYKPLATELLEYYKGLIKMRKAFPELSACSDFRFVLSNDDNAKKGYKTNTFKSRNLKKLKIKFINAPADKEFYVVGEVHAEEANPENNQYKISIDSNGNGEIVFNEVQISNFDLKKWDFSRYLNLKLVETPGKWDAPEYAYSSTGNNKINPSAINENFEVTLDLSKKDYIANTLVNKGEYDYIAYLISSSKNNFIIIHNTRKETLNFKNNLIKNLKNACIIVDENKAGIISIEKSKTRVEISGNSVNIPRKSSVVIKFER